MEKLLEKFFKSLFTWSLYTLSTLAVVIVYFSPQDIASDDKVSDHSRQESDYSLSYKAEITPLYEELDSTVIAPTDLIPTSNPYVFIRGNEPVYHNYFEYFLSNEVNECVLDLFYSDGGYFVLTDNATIVSEYNSELDYTSYKLLAFYQNVHKKSDGAIINNCIYVNDCVEAVNELSHELGHYIDAKLNYPSDSSEWDNIRSVEAVNLDSYFSNDSSEYFAECYKMYYNDVNEFALNYPMSYQYILMQLNNLEMIY